MPELNIISSSDHAEAERPAAAGAVATSPTPAPEQSLTSGAGKPLSKGAKELQRQPLYQLYSRPLPLRIFPFPTFTASNPLSLVHLAFAWMGQIIFPPPPEPSVVHTAYWDRNTRSIIVTDERAMEVLWQQGFYGKGSLSRSEPNWLKRESIRLGTLEGRVSEAATEKRRADRSRAKWERARAEQEALEQRRLEEARAQADAVAVAEATAAAAPVPKLAPSPILMPPVGPLELLTLPNSQADLASQCSLRGNYGAALNGTNAPMYGAGSHRNDYADSRTTVPPRPSGGLRHSKSVRFSPDVESATFQRNDPPSPPHSISSSSSKKGIFSGPSGTSPAVPATTITPMSRYVVEAEVPAKVNLANKEHLQLAYEESFFLVFAVGALQVVDSATQTVLTISDLFALLRQNSYFPPRVTELPQPDDPFLTNYAIYHHFRSLGFVPRPGVKFGVDWLLYNRGPVFDHAEYGLVVIPSYTDPGWNAVKGIERQQLRMSWHCLMGVNRVLTKVFKTLVLVYVDIPPPSAFVAGHYDNVIGMQRDPVDGLTGLLKRYRIREQVIKRWSSNRNR